MNKLIWRGWCGPGLIALQDWLEFVLGKNDSHNLTVMPLGMGMDAAIQQQKWRNSCCVCWDVL